MKDLHCHILFNLDDGSKSIEESINILKKAEEEGITEVILTPHYITNTRYSFDNKTKEDKIKELKKEVKKNKINIKLYLGNENYIDGDILNYIKSNKMSTLNKSKYILIELPVRHEFINLYNVIFNLMCEGYVPIIAHPERYMYIQKDISYLDKLLDTGVLLQGNYQSLLGKYGSKAKKTLKKLIKQNKITFLASDTHHESDEYNLLKLNKVLLKLLSQDQINDLLNNNFDKVIKNKDI